MKFYIPKNSEWIYSHRTRGIIISNTLGQPHGVINDLSQANCQDLYIIQQPVFKREILSFLIKNKIKFILDISDYKFDKGDTLNLYKEAVDYCKCVTTTCEYLAEVIKRLLGKDAIIIKDLTERKEIIPVLKKYTTEDHIKCVCYGSRKNMRGINSDKILSSLKKIHKNTSFTIITNKRDDDPSAWIQWSYEVQEKLVAEADFIIIPVTKVSEMAKSKGNNRPVDAIRQGKFVITSDVIPSYKELDKFIYIGDIQKGFEYAITNQKQVYEKILQGQSYIRSTFDPIVIANQWKLLEERL